MKSPKILYILISAFCIFAIIAGIYVQFIDGGSQNYSFNGNEDKVGNQKDQETIKTEFNNLFTNTINLNGYDTTSIARMKADKEIVYTAIDINEVKEAYEINIKIPAFNINNEEAKGFNASTQATFVDKARKVLAVTDTTSKTIYSIDYVGFVNGDILSVVIRSTLKEGDNAQRVMIQTYNYDIANNKQVNLTDLITRKNLNKEDVNTEIKRVVKIADDEAKAVQNMGYNEIFSRDLEDQIYVVENSGTFLLGPDNQLYIIYPYGNKNFTSEMDIVLFE